MRRLVALIALGASSVLLLGGIAGADTTTTTTEPTTTTTTMPSTDCGVAAVGGTIACDLSGLLESQAVVKAVNGTDSDVRVTNRKGEIHFHLNIDSPTTAKLDHAVEVAVQCGDNTLTATSGPTSASGTFTVDCPTTSSTDVPSANSASNRSAGLRAAPALRVANAPNSVAAAAANCDPSYPDFCIPAGQEDLDCDQVGRANFTVKPPDPYGFDEGDGIGCVDDSLGKDAVVPPDNSAPAAVTPGSATPSAPKPAPVTPSANATGAAASQSADTGSNLAKTGLSVARQVATGALLLGLGYIFVSWSRRRSAIDAPFL